MIRLLNIICVMALLGCAIYAYDISYETIYYAERIAKTRHDIAVANDEIGFLKADWAHLTSPSRIQVLADKNLNLHDLALNQIIKIDSLPQKMPKVDAIGRKLADLGLDAPTNTPATTAHAGVTTPVSKKTKQVTSTHLAHAPLSINALLQNH